MSDRPEIITPPVTVFAPDGTVDLDGTRAVMEHVEPIVDAVFTVGTTGEFPALTRDERRDLVGVSLDVFGPGRTIAHIGGPSLHQALEYAQDAWDVGVRRAAAITPYYLTASDASIGHYYAGLRAAFSGELYAYIFPDVACSDVTPALLGELADLVDGLKVSGIASGRVDEYRESAPGLVLWSGNDADLPHVMAAGGRGIVSGVSGVAPRAFADLRDAIETGDSDAVDRAQGRVQVLVEALGPSIAHLKYGLELCGFSAGHPRMAVDPLNDSTRRQIRSVLTAQGVLHDGA